MGRYDGLKCPVCDTICLSGTGTLNFEANTHSIYWGCVNGHRFTRTTEFGKGWDEDEPEGEVKIVRHKDNNSTLKWVGDKFVYVPLSQQKEQFEGGS